MELAKLQVTTKLVESRYNIVNELVVLNIYGAGGSVALSSALALGLVDHASAEVRLPDSNEISSLPDVMGMLPGESSLTMESVSAGMKLYCAMHLEAALTPLELVALAGMTVLAAFYAHGSNTKLFDVPFDGPDSATVHSRKPSDALHVGVNSILQTWNVNGRGLCVRRRCEW